MNLAYILLLVLSLVVVMITVVFTGKMNDVMEVNSDFSLKDVIHDNIENVFLFDSIANISMLVAFLLVLISFYRKWTRSVFVMPTFLIMFCILFSLRLLLIYCTRIPHPNNNMPPGFLSKIHNMFSREVNVSQTHDYMFSGHVTLFFLFVLCIKDIWKLNNLKTNILLLLFVVFYAFCVASSREHYTIDVIIAFVFTGLMYLVIKPRSSYINKSFAYVSSSSSSYKNQIL